MENNNDIEYKIFLSIKEKISSITPEEIEGLVKDELKANGYEDWQIYYGIERIKKMVEKEKNPSKKDIPEIKEMLDTLLRENPNEFEEIIRLEKQSSGEVDLVISGVEVNLNYTGNIFITDKNIYFITTQLSKSSSLPAYIGGASFMSGGVLFGLGGILAGELINKLTNKPQTFEKSNEIPLNVLAKYINGSFKIELSEILLVRINKKNNHLVFKTRNNNEWSYNFSTANSEDREKVEEIIQRNDIEIEPAKGLLKTLKERFSTSS